MKLFKFEKLGNSYNTKGQAAMEFLMTYGWALLVVVIVIAAFTGFIGMDFKKFLPDKVNLPTGFVVHAVTVDESFVNFYIQNNMGKEINSLQINVTECGSGGAKSSPVDLLSGKVHRVTIPCPGLEPKTKFESDLYVNYLSRTVSDYLYHKKSGDMIAEVSEGCKSSDIIAGWNLNGDGNDCSGNGNHCTEVGTVSYGGDYLTLGGGVNYLNCGDSEALSFNFSRDYSYSVWFNVDSGNAADANCLFADELDNDPADGFEVYFVADNQLTVYTEPDFEEISSVSTFNFNEWNHYLVTYDSLDGNVSAYLNGNYDASMDMTITDSNGDFSIGFCPYYYVGMVGMVDQVVVYNKVLDESEVLSLYRAGRG